MNAVDHTHFMDVAYEEALQGYNEGGVPVGSVLVRGGEVIGRGRNRRQQQGDPILHGEMDCLKNAGRQSSYADTQIYTTLSPCPMCTGAILLFKIPTVVVGENETFMGEEGLLRARGVQVIVLNDERCIALMSKFVEEKPELWNEDIAV
ncbi:nucleoside deaminase [Bauldia sp.]|uniref:nucleoside deaminase n=1 Tax=Bauldia sp. TaxID=2575872 RepID=UPI003BAA47DA